MNLNYRKDNYCETIKKKKSQKNNENETIILSKGF